MKRSNHILPHPSQPGTKRLRAVFVGVLFLLLILPASAQVNDFGTWWGVEIRKKFRNGIRLSLELETRLNQNSAYLRNVYVEPGITYKPLKWLRLGLQYRFDNRYQREDSYFLQRHRISFDLQFEYTLKRFEFEYRNRTQMHWENYFDDDISYPEMSNRNLLGINYKWPQLPFRTLLNGELWIPLERDAWVDRFRLTVAQEVTFKTIHRIQLRFLFQTELNESDPTREFILSTRYAIML